MTAMNSLEERIRVYRHLRRRSDHVRSQLIPSVLSEGPPAAQVFFDMTKTYFDDDIRSGQLVSNVDLMKAENTEIKPYVPTMEELARPRTHRCKSVGFETLHPRYLNTLSSNFFRALDEDRPRRLRGEFDFNFLLIANFFLQLAHIAEDGTGRTGEDLLVLLAAESGRTMTISSTGYRGALEGVGYPLFYRLIANRILYLEVAGNFYKSVGLPVPERVSFDINHIVKELAEAESPDNAKRTGWPDGLGPEIGDFFKTAGVAPGADEELFQPTHPYRFFAEFLACELIYFTLCLRDPSRYIARLKERYPASVNCCRHNFIASLGNSYHAIPEQVGDISDKVVALIEAVRMGWADKDDEQLNHAVARLEARDGTIGKLFRQELSLFVNEDQKTALKFPIPVGMTGEQLDRQIKDFVKTARG